MPTASRRALRSFATFVLVTTFAGDMWRDSLSWWGFGAIALGVLITCITLLARSRPLPRVRVLPIPLLAFTGVAVLSIAWSQYRPESALGVLIQLSTSIAALTLVVLLSWSEIVQGLGRALRIILGLSLAFELFVAVVVRGPVMPFFTDYGPRAPAAFAWTRGSSSAAAGSRASSATRTCSPWSRCSASSCSRCSTRRARSAAATPGSGSSSPSSP
ncbi:hypothetical protein [Clavibacter michiganensis]|uniref:hypothetical protein n=1 Tax=Clavibacter michiganensis TaxID=28447 RepID=UPI001FB4B7F4|nr:hypothetical protein [Clavibacter michiganensis]